ncbi:hypothetical protein [Pseudoflavitalea rhizosphaerae]|uniref:hypothetical protein n=1 Tax=Pseudoflavitalea rhizosphaerae TaxID=1884793 RepID=UPI000F8EFEF5|nr:hypothetical protein [Pseudoflavitalea rhizosphaerae]
MHENKRTKFFNKPVRLTREQKKNPSAVILEFFTTYHLDDIRHLLWQWIEAAMTSDGDQFESPSDRSDLLFFYRNLELMSEAAYMIVRKDLPASMRKSQHKKNHSSE